MRLTVLLPVLLLAAMRSAVGAPTTCPQLFAAGVAPDLLRPGLQERTRPLCYRAFAVLHSGVSRTPLYAAEHLTPAELEGARSIHRVDEFHDDPNLPPDERAQLSDYARSGYSRGHMAPAGDMPTPEAQAESFSLANMVPQNGPLNRGLWEQIETAVRNDAMQTGSLYVVTGPAFTGNRLKSLKGRVLVPTHIWKAVYDPSRNSAAAYVCPNDASGRMQVVSINDLIALTGIDPFPALGPAPKGRILDLPMPEEHGSRRHRRSRSDY